MEHGLMIFVLIIALAIIYFFGIKVLLWCILLGIIIAVCTFFYMIFESEGRFNKIIKWRKRVWKKYENLEDKFFKWIDSI